MKGMLFVFARKRQEPEDVLVSRLFLICAQAVAC